MNVEKRVKEYVELRDEMKTQRQRRTLRMPGSLKRRIDKAAKNDNLALNEWIIRCLERKLQERE